MKTHTVKAKGIEIFQQTLTREATAKAAETKK